MNLVKCFLSFVLLLLYVEFNSAVDCDAQERTLTTLEAKLAKCITEPAEPTSCLAFGNSSDIQTIRVPGAEAFQVPCDSKFAGPGWAVIQRRVDGSVNFNRTWEEYRNGFGDLRGSFWLGLERLHQMIKYQPHELYIHTKDFRNITRHKRYSNFAIGNEAQSYKLLSVGEFSGNGGNMFDAKDGLSAINMKFSTPDRDNDRMVFDNCAADYASGWWFTYCSWSNLDVVYDFYTLDLTFVQMMIRPKGY